MLTQHLTGSLVRQPVTVTPNDLHTIHTLSNPPLSPLAESDIHIRRCRLASDRMDSRFGRFRTDDMPRLLELVQGAPVLIGHDHRSLGVARFFGGEVETRDGTSWIVPRFYWLKAHSRAEDLRVMIDGGIYNEASIAFVYQKPTCSVCGKDIRECSHWPGRDYDGETCFFWYDGVEQVTEGSLVYRGAAPGTGFELPAGQESNPKQNSQEGSPEEHFLLLKHRGKRYRAVLHPAT